MWMQSLSPGYKRAESTIEYGTSSELHGTSCRLREERGSIHEKPRYRQVVSLDSIQTLPPHLGNYLGQTKPCFAIELLSVAAFSQQFAKPLQSQLGARDDLRRRVGPTIACC